MFEENNRYKGKGILFFDHEGGFGGSSRSLYYLIRKMDFDRFHPVVIVKKNGPILDKYNEISVPCYYIPDLPTFRPGDRKRIVSFAFFLLLLIRFPNILRQLSSIVKEHDIRQIHANHESISLATMLVARHLNLPWSCHIRSQLTPSFFARMLYRAIARSSRRIIFITDQNMTHFKALAGSSFDFSKSAVVFNIVPDTSKETQPRTELLDCVEKMHLISLSNFSPKRGIDRLVEVADALRRFGRKDFVFHLYGHSSNTKLFSGNADSYMLKVKETVQRKRLQDMVLFHGHIPDPERALAGGDVLIKLARDGCPWGRDLMEAMAAGLPVVALGAYEAVVENGVNGYLSLQFNPIAIAMYLIQLKDEKDAVRTIGLRNKEKALRLFNGTTNAALAEEVFASVRRQR